MSDTLTFHIESRAPLSPQSVLRIRNFRLSWIGEVVSHMGEQFYLIALPWLVQSIHFQQPGQVINAIHKIVEKAWVAQMLEIK